MPDEIVAGGPGRYYYWQQRTLLDQRPCTYLIRPCPSRRRGRARTRQVRHFHAPPFHCPSFFGLLLTLPYRQWREQRALALEHRDQLSESRKQETIKAARAAIDDFYENYNAKKEKNIAQTRKEAESFLASREDTSAGGTSWERIAKLVDLSGKGARGGATGTGKERFRELLLSLKKDDKAPGATGY